jgi:CBS-domain-containing membrane protein
MKFPRHKFDELKYHLLWQTVLCAFFMGFVLFIMGLLSKNSSEWEIGATSLASSAYSVFALPKSVVAEPRRIFLAYVIATIVGLSLHFVLGYFVVDLSSQFMFLDSHFFWVLAGVAVALCMLFMMIFGAQHPPATGVALSMVIDVHNWGVFWGIWISLLVLLALRIGLSKQLKDLVE